MRSTIFISLFLVLLTAMMASPAPCRAQEEAAEVTEVEATEAEKGADEVAEEKPSFGHRLLYYLPNRLLDVVDVFRLRARVGPGLAVNLRATDYISFYGGTYRSVYAGLPGARTPEKWRSPVGLEDQKGLIFFGIDATDTTPHGPRYTPAEFTLGGQLLIVGGDIGFEPVEFGDFFAGLVFLDPVGDDL